MTYSFDDISKLDRSLRVEAVVRIVREKLDAAMDDDSTAAVLNGIHTQDVASLIDMAANAILFVADNGEWERPNGEMDKLQSSSWRLKNRFPGS